MFQFSIPTLPVMSSFIPFISQLWIYLSHLRSELKDGASYHGSFAALIQSQALLKQGLRYDLQFTPSQVRLSINPLNLTTKTANRNEANAVNALNQLRDSRLALSQNCNDPLKSCSGHNEWRSQT